MIGLFVAGAIGAFSPDLDELLVIIGILAVSIVLMSLPPIYFLQQLTEMSARDGESQFLVLINGITTSGGVITLLILFFDYKWVYFAAVLCVAIGDGLGEFIGRPYGKHKYKIFSQKSLEGSFGVFFGSLVGGTGSILAFQVFSLHYFLIILLASLAVTLVEAFSVVFLDNLIMQFSYAGILWFFLIR